MVELCFADRRDNSRVIIPPEQMKRILNFCKLFLTRDSGKGRRGSQPEVTFHDPHFPVLGAGTSKSGVTSTIIAGSTAAGKPVPPHFKFSSQATTEEGERIRNEFVKHTPDISGKFGNDDVINMPVILASI